MNKNKSIPPEPVLLTDKREITYWLNAHKINNFYVHENESGKLVVDVFNDVNLSNMELLTIGVQFNSVAGDFNVSNNNLYYLKGCPLTVKGSFRCNNNFLSSLDCGPQEVGNSYNCSNNRLTNLIGSPEYIENFFTASFNRLTSLEGCPVVIKNSEFSISHNKLETLAFFPQQMLSSTDLKYNRALGLYQNLFIFEEIYEIHLAQKEQLILKSLLPFDCIENWQAPKNKASKI